MPMAGRNRPLCRPPPAAECEVDGARAFGGKLKAAGGRHGEPRDLGDNSAKPAVPQTLLEADEDRLFVYHLEIDPVGGHERVLPEGRGERVRALNTAKALPPGPLRGSRRKK